MDAQQQTKVIAFQKEEITNHYLYLRLADTIKDKHNAGVIREMAATELNHYKFWNKISQVEVQPNKVLIFFFMVMARLLGLTFSIKLIEKAESVGAKEYEEFDAIVPGAAQLGKDEEEHEIALAGMIEEDAVGHVGGAPRERAATFPRRPSRRPPRAAPP